jgi:hypothetical protein
MRLGSQGRNAARLFVLVLLVSALTGCRWLPIQSSDNAAFPPLPKSVDREIVDQGVDPKDLPRLPTLHPVPDHEAFASSSTPLLDEAWARLLTTEPKSVPRPTAVAMPARVESDPRDPTTTDTLRKPPLDPILVRASAPAKVESAPFDDWKTGVERLRTLAHQKAASDTNDETRTWDLRERLLTWLAGEAADEKAELWQFVLSALASPVISSETAAVQPVPVDDDPLAISEMRLCRRVRGYGNFDPLERAAIRSGEPVLIYWEVSGLHYEGEAPTLKSRIHARLEVFAAGGSTSVWSEDLGRAEDTCRRARRDYFMNYRIHLPPTLKPGPYELRLILRDEVTGRDVNRALDFTLEPQP